MGHQPKPLELIDVLNRLDGGGTVEEIKSKLREVAEAVLDTGNQGSVTIKLTFARNGGDGSRQLVIKDQVSSVQPRRPKPASLLFVDHDGCLTVSDPDQPRFAAMEGA